MTKQELEKIYFDFYDQLEEPYCSQAKENWDYDWCKETELPKSVLLAVYWGFDFYTTKQGHRYWDSLSVSINNSLKPKESYFKQITDGICELLTEKDKRYGSFIETPLGIFEGKCASGRDIDKKLSRVKNSGELRLNDIADIIGYLILAMKDKNWTKQDILNLID